MDLTRFTAMEKLQYDDSTERFELNFRAGDNDVTNFLSEWCSIIWVMMIR
jgi:hypothetical protein